MSLSKKRIKSLFVSVLVLGFVNVAYGQNTKNLSDLQGLENSEDRSNSPSQLVILNNSPSSSQQQQQDSNQTARQGWGTGESLEYLRNHRMRKESQNEQALMEKLEESRVEDERSRLEKLFSIRQRQTQKQSLGGSVAIIQPDAGDKRLALVKPQYSNTSYERVSSADDNNWYLRGQLGIGTYRAENAENSASWGLAVGKSLGRKLHVEFNFMSSGYKVNDPRGNYEVDYDGNSIVEPEDLRDLVQLNYSGVLGYNIAEYSEFTMALRAGVSYVKRVSQSSNIDKFSEVNTNTFDLVLGASGDLRLIDQFYLVGTFDYFKNLANDTDRGDRFSERVESADYFVLGVGLKCEF